MTHTPHELAEQFPDDHDRLHELKLSDAHFARLEADYHRLNREIHRAETDLEPVADHVLEEMKKRRLALLDEIAARLQAA
ncbi:hypothetical protein LNKW23_10510 [Paralimibaculum aggregatum]|uniref:DUF465 domain-containing protein n=1 Tax=Paralimibaculum aggregatum TaxID=3036245 RepID=A0ABQ6LKS5_9RHOB|nr:DUF465 domain-containing protein [Limibaculum sp. NKW23]GMG81838.1 hypothetical protein LNKW23_10510 [Limibaculum sp. NKW23]